MKPQTQEMKTIVTSLRNAICVIILTCAFSNSFSQTNIQATNAISDLKAVVVNNSLVIDWVVAETTTSNYCEVQASKDGVTFSTIGMVMGADPKMPGSFKFKQSLNKMKTGKVFYRVLNVENGGRSVISNIIKAA